MIKLCEVTEETQHMAVTFINITLKQLPYTIVTLLQWLASN